MAKTAKNKGIIPWEKITKAEHRIVTKIAERAVGLRDRQDLIMDIEATHINCPLRLKDLLEADDFNFAHDVFGIMDHINRETGQLQDFFRPRFIKKERIKTTKS